MAVVVADPYSTGGRLPILLSERGFDVIALWTAEVSILPACCKLIEADILNLCRKITEFVPQSRRET